MRRLLPFLLLLATPALANNPQADFIAAQASNGVVGVASSYGQPDFRIDYSAGATTQQKANAATAAASFNWTPTANPDPYNAKLAILADSNIPNAAKVELMKFTDLFDKYSENATATKQAWALIVSVYSGSWLNNTVKTAVQQHAADFNLPLE